MTDAALLSDIERIAALRKRPASDFMPRARDQVWASDKLNHALTDRIFKANPNPIEDLQALDKLPPVLRELVRNSPVMLSAGYLRSLLAIVDGHAELLIEVLRERYPELAAAEDTPPKRSARARRA